MPLTSHLSFVFMSVLNGHRLPPHTPVRGAPIKARQTRSTTLLFLLQFNRHHLDGLGPFIKAGLTLGVSRASVARLGLRAVGRTAHASQPYVCYEQAP